MIRTADLPCKVASFIALLHDFLEFSRREARALQRHQDDDVRGRILGPRDDPPGVVLPSPLPILAVARHSESRQRARRYGEGVDLFLEVSLSLPALEVGGHGALPEAAGRVHLVGAEAVETVDLVLEGERGGAGAEVDAPSAQRLQGPWVAVLGCLGMVS